MRISITIAIPTHNRPESLRVCLESVLKQAHKTDGIAIAVTDDSRTEITKSLVQTQFPQVIYMEGPKSGLAANRNNIFKNIRSDWYFFIDDDTYVLPGYVDAVVTACSSTKNPCLFEGRIIANRPRQSMKEIAPLNDSGGSFIGANIGIHREVLNAIGGFNEDFVGYGYEEVEFHIRALKARFECRFLDYAVICHPWRPAHSLIHLLPSIDNEIQTCNLHSEVLDHKGALTLLKITIGRLTANISECRKLNWKGLSQVSYELILDLYRIWRFFIFRLRKRNADN